MLGNLKCAVQKGTDTGTFSDCASAPATWRPRSFQYDSLSRLLTANNPESGAISYTYDANGNVASKVVPKQNQTNPTKMVTLSYCYDALNRMIGKAYTAQSCPMSSPAATYSYDQGANGIGRRTGMTDTPGSSTWVYDYMGRVASETRVTSNVTKTSSYVYNLDGSVQSATYPSGRTLNYTYSPDNIRSAGKVLSIIDPIPLPNGPINYVTSATYAAPGGVKTYLSGVTGQFNGITTADFYNSRLQPCRLWSGTGGTVPTICTNGSTGTIMDLRYDFHVGLGDNGNVYQIMNNRDNNRTQNFTYDDLNRIRQAYTTGSNWGETYGSATAPGGIPSTSGIDAWGNLWQISEVTGKTDHEGLNQSVQNNNTLSGFGYDVAGNMTSNGSTTYQYDAENHFTKFITTSTDIYYYDGDGKRVKKNTDTITLYWYDQSGNVIDETTSTGALRSEYVYFNGNRIARRDSDNSVKYYFSDHLGSASVITDAVGTMSPHPLTESDYYPYGGEIPIWTGDSNHYKYTGKERDSESGWDNFDARHYGSSLGRFMSPDPSGLLAQKPIYPQSWNLYAYALNNPLIFVDPTGLDCVYANDAGNGVESIDHNSNSGECGDNGGTWAPGYADENWAHFNENTGLFQVGSVDGVGKDATVDYTRFEAGAQTDAKGGCLSGCADYGFASANANWLQNQLAGNSRLDGLDGYIQFLTGRDEPLHGGLLVKLAAGPLDPSADHWAGPGGMGPPGGRGDWAASVHDYNFSTNGITMGSYFNPALSVATSKALIQSNSNLMRNAGGIQGAKMRMFFGVTNAFQWYANSWK